MKTKKHTADDGRRGLSRREFLAGTTAAGVALGLPSLIAGCGSDDCDPAAPPTPTAMPTAPPGERPRETRTLHFDFSFAELENLRLAALHSTAHGVALTPHDDRTRARFRDRNPLLRNVADERLTHYVEGVDLPSDALQHVWFTGTVPATGETALAGLIIHVPQAVARATSLRCTNMSDEP